MDASEPNPYESPKSVADVAESPPLAQRGWRSGPAVYIALGALVGGVAGVPLFMVHNVLGYVAVVPGALLAGLAFRARARRWPSDPFVKRRRYAFAAIVAVVIPGFFLLTAGLGGQGVRITFAGLMFGLGLASGILVSGDRRSEAPQPIE